MRSDRVLKRWYRTVNKRFFNNKLPDNICVKWGDEEDEDEEENWEEKYNGYAVRLKDNRYHYAAIVINNELRKNRSFMLAVLVHEMIHIATDLKDDHGPAFERYRILIGNKGIFKKGALLKGCTLF